MASLGSEWGSVWEALTNGEKNGFDPRAQWQANLSIGGGPQRLAEPLVDWSTQASGTTTLFQQLVSAGELAQRSPTGPTYLNVPIEIQLNEWNPPEEFRMAPPAPKPVKKPTTVPFRAHRLVRNSAGGRKRAFWKNH